MAATGDVGVDLSSQPSLASVDMYALYLNLGRRKSREAFIEALTRRSFIIVHVCIIQGLSWTHKSQHSSSVGGRLGHDRCRQIYQMALKDIQVVF